MPAAALNRHPIEHIARAPQRIGAIAAIALHGVAIAALLSHEPARQALLEVAPIMVSLITPPQPPVKKPEPPKPRPEIRPAPVRSPDPLPVLVAAPEAPSPAVVPPPPPPPPKPAPIAAPPAPPALPAAPASVKVAEVPVTAPVFDAAYLDNPAPAYPAQSRRMGEQGRVVLRVLVSASGRAEEVQVRTGSGSRRLDDSAMDTVKRWKFLPARRGAEAVPAWVLIPISFQLQS